MAGGSTLDIPRPPGLQRGILRRAGAARYVRPRAAGAGAFARRKSAQALCRGAMTADGVLTTELALWMQSQPLFIHSLPAAQGASSCRNRL